MSVQELEVAVTNLSREQLAEFQHWFEQFLADSWDRQLEEDIKAGRLEHMAEKADQDFEAGRCRPL